MKLKTLKPLLFFCLGFYSLAVLASELQTYDIQYQTRAKGFNLKTVRKLEKKSGYFELNLTTSTVMMQTIETSTFSVDEQGIFTPRSYHYQRKIFGNNSTRQNDFSPVKKTATYIEKNSDPVQVAIPAEIYDVLSYHEKIRQDLSTQPEQFMDRTFNVLERQRVRQHVFKYAGNELLSTPLGYLDTVKIERVRENSSKKTTVWLAKDWGYVIVRILHQEPGEPDYKLNIVQGVLEKTPIIGKQNLPATN